MIERINDLCADLHEQAADKSLPSAWRWLAWKLAITGDGICCMITGNWREAWWILGWSEEYGPPVNHDDCK